MSRHNCRRDGDRDDDIVFLTEYGRMNSLNEQRRLTCEGGDIESSAYYYRTLGHRFNCAENNGNLITNGEVLTAAGIPEREAAEVRPDFVSGEEEADRGRRRERRREREDDLVLLADEDAAARERRRERRRERVERQNLAEFGEQALCERRITHSTLSERDCPNQHPIAAIAGLREELSRMRRDIDEFEEHSVCLKRAALPIIMATKSPSGNLYSGSFACCLNEIEGGTRQFLMAVNEPNTASVALRIGPLPDAVLVKQHGNMISALAPFELIVGIYYHIVFDARAGRYVLVR